LLPFFFQQQPAFFGAHTPQKRNIHPQFFFFFGFAGLLLQPTRNGKEPNHAKQGSSTSRLGHGLANRPWVLPIPPSPPPFPPPASYFSRGATRLAGKGDGRLPSFLFHNPFFSPGNRRCRAGRARILTCPPVEFPFFPNKFLAFFTLSFCCPTGPSKAPPGPPHPFPRWIRPAASKSRLLKFFRRPSPNWWLCFAPFSPKSHESPRRRARPVWPNQAQLCPPRGF